MHEFFVTNNKGDTNDLNGCLIIFRQKISGYHFY